MTPADQGLVTEEELFHNLSLLSGDAPEVIAEDFNSRVKINLDLVNYITTLRKKYKLILLSNALGSWLRKILKKFDLESKFDIIVISSEVNALKPQADIFNLALDKAGVKANEAVFTDDNIVNIKGADAVGINTIHYTEFNKFKTDLSSLLGKEI
jgi:putative hydrolase of the HAD superfamily